MLDRLLKVKIKNVFISIWLQMVNGSHGWMQKNLKRGSNSANFLVDVGIQIILKAGHGIRISFAKEPYSFAGGPDTQSPLWIRA